MRHLVLVFGDQLSESISALDGFDPKQDHVWMAEVDNEATKVRCHKVRLAFFFSAMRHFRQGLDERGWEVDYQKVDQRGAAKTFSEALRKSIKKHKPKKVIFTEAGDWFIQNEVEQTLGELEVAFEKRTDRHFYCTLADFFDWANGKKSLVLEHFYRWMRKEHRVLIDKQNKPIGGDWNFDKENRETFGKEGPPDIPEVKGYTQDEITKDVIKMINRRYADHPGDLSDFDYPVTRDQALIALKEFVEQRLANFGRFQDAMWSETEFLFHSRISAVMNAHLIEPFEAVNAAIDAYEAGKAPINSVEGFVRQIVGWREFVRGIYWSLMPDYIERNSLECDEERDVPEAFWNGKSETEYIHQAMQPVIKYSYAHHIQRLMILGLYAQMLGVHPRKFHDWHIAMYADAIDWVSLPNTLGMSQHGDGGVVGTKPYCASGNYVDRMSNYCKKCRFKPKVAHGEDACPITTMYWDFLDRHRDAFKDNRRMVFQIKNLEKKADDELQLIKDQAVQHLAEVYS